MLETPERKMFRTSDSRSAGGTGAPWPLPQQEAARFSAWSSAPSVGFEAPRSGLAGFAPLPPWASAALFCWSASRIRLLFLEHLDAGLARMRRRSRPRVPTLKPRNLAPRTRTRTQRSHSDSGSPVALSLLTICPARGGYVSTGTACVAALGSRPYDTSSAMCTRAGRAPRRQRVRRPVYLGQTAVETAI